MVDHLVHQPAGQGGFCVDHAAREHHFHGLAFADDLGQALRAAVTRNHAEAHFRKAHPGVGRSDAHVCRHGQFESATEGKPVDGGHHGLAALLDPVKQVALSAPCQVLALGLVEVRKFLDVRAGHKGFLARARQDDDPHIVVVLGGFEGGTQGVNDAAVERVERFGTVNRQGEDSVLQGFQNKGHERGVARSRYRTKLHNATLGILPRTA